MISYLKLAALAMMTVKCVSASDAIDRSLQGDFNWDVMPEDGYPIIGFDDTTETSEVVFKYNYTGTLSATKTLTYNLYQLDCVSPADAALGSTSNILGDELTVDIDIIQETITNSIHYNEIDNTAAEINFCMRVDYNFNGPDGLESINFHETNVTITVDLLANFTLDSIITDRTAADAADAEATLDYPVEAYICQDDNSEVLTPSALTQGSVLQFCVKIDDTVTTENILVEDILTFVLSQPGGTATDSVPITNTQPDALTDKACRENGICNIRTQLASKFFTETNPQPLRVDGVAILAFGKASSMPSSAPTSAPTPAPGARRLRVPISGTLSADQVRNLLDQQEKANAATLPSRELQDAGAQSPFDLNVDLNGAEQVQNVQGTQPAEESSNTVIIAVVVVVVVVLVTGLAWYFCVYKKKQQKLAGEQQKSVVVSSYNGSQQQRQGGVSVTYGGQSNEQFD